MEKTKRGPAEEIKELLTQSRKIALLVPSSPDADSAAAALALYHLIIQTGREAVPVVPGELPHSCSFLPGVGAVRRDFGPKKLFISFDAHGTAVEKVDYFQEGERFNLVVHPLEGSFDKSQVEWSAGGGDFDLLVTLKVKSLKLLGRLEEEVHQIATRKPLLNIDIDRGNENFGRINFIDEGFLNVSELLLVNIPQWELPLNREAGLCLLCGLKSSPAKSGDNRSGEADSPETVPEEGARFLRPTNVYPSPLSSL